VGGGICWSVCVCMCVYVCVFCTCTTGMRVCVCVHENMCRFTHVCVGICRSVFVQPECDCMYARNPFFCMYIYTGGACACIESRISNVEYLLIYIKYVQPECNCMYAQNASVCMRACKYARRFEYVWARNLSFSIWQYMFVWHIDISLGGTFS